MWIEDSIYTQKQKQNLNCRVQICITRQSFAMRSSPHAVQRVINMLNRVLPSYWSINAKVQTYHYFHTIVASTRKSSPILQKFIYAKVTTKTTNKSVYFVRFVALILLLLLLPLMMYYHLLIMYFWTSFSWAQRYWLWYLR